MVIMLIGRRADNGTQVAFCLDDHHWTYTEPPALRGWIRNHVERDHGQPLSNAKIIEVPTTVLYRPSPVDQGAM